ncbi:hypothetical protein HKD37_14G040009 [Glycine soja]
MLDLALMNTMKTIFPKSTNLLCRFHIDKNVKAKCKTIVGSLVDCPSKQEFDDCLMKFEIVCSPWSLFVDYVKQTWLIPIKKDLLKPRRIRVESAHWALRRLMQNILGDLYSVWEAMNNMITLQHTKIKTSFETSTHVVGHVFKVTLYKKLLGMVSRYALNQIAAEFECINYAGIDSSRCGCIMRTTHDLPCACELVRYVIGSLSELEVSITEKMKAISKRFEELDVCGKVTLKSKLREIAYPDLNSMYAPLEKVKTKGAQKKQMTKHQRSTKHDPSYWEYVDALYSVQNSNSLVKQAALSFEQPKPKRKRPMLDQFHPCIHNFIENIIDVKDNGNYGYRAITCLLGIGEDSWSLVNMDKWMNITNMGYVIASRYNVLVNHQNIVLYMALYVLVMCMTIILFRDACPLPPIVLLWSTQCHYNSKQWPTPYISRMHQYTNLMRLTKHYVDLGED